MVDTIVDVLLKNHAFEKDVWYVDLDGYIVWNGQICFHSLRQHK